MSDTLGQLLAGTTAGMTSVLIDYPLDTLKTRMQVAGACSPRRRLKPVCNARAYSVTVPAMPSSTIVATANTASKGASYMGCVRDTWASGGVAGFYRGITIPLLAQGTECAVIFSVFAATERQLRGYFESHRARSSTITSSPSASAVVSPSIAPYQRGELWCAAAASGAAVSIILTPVEFVKGNLQVARRSGSSGGILTFCRSVVQQRGLRGFYTGFAGTFARAVAGNTVYFLTYRQLLHVLSEKRPLQGGLPTYDTPASPPAAWLCILAGGLSGCAYWTIAYPCDVAKTRMQVCTSLTSSFTAKPHASSASVASRSRGCPPTLRGALARTYREGGVNALYRGWGVTVVRAFASSAIVFSVYERAQRHLKLWAGMPTPVVCERCDESGCAGAALENPAFEWEGASALHYE